MFILENLSKIGICFMFISIFFYFVTTTLALYESTDSTHFPNVNAMKGLQTTACVFAGIGMLLFSFSIVKPLLPKQGFRYSDMLK